MTPLKGMSQEPKSLCYVPQRRNMGLPKGREPYGNGVPIVVVGVTTHQRGRESRPQGKGGQVVVMERCGGARDA